MCMNVCVVLFVCVCLQLEGYEGGSRDSEPNGSFLCASRQLLTVAENIGPSEIADVSVCSQQNTHTHRARERTESLLLFPLVCSRANEDCSYVIW